MLIKPKYQSGMKIIPFIIISAIIFIFNIISIWGYDGLVIDDQAYYVRLFGKSISDLEFKRNIIHSLFTLGIIKVATYSSVYFARFLIIFILSIPSAFLLYYFSNSHFQLKKHASIAIAVLPFILPNEVFVPTYLAGSYMLLAILFALISIHFILKFSNRLEFSLTGFVLAAIFYYLATESSELSASMLPVFLFLIFIFRKLSWKQFLLGSMITFIAVRKSLLVIQKPHGGINSISNELPVREILYRILHFPDFINPLYGLGNTYILNFIALCVILVAAILVFRKQERLTGILDHGNSVEKPGNRYFYMVYYYLFPIVWIIFSTIPFLFFSQHYASRYFTVASLALSFLFITSIFVITGSLTKRKIPFVLMIILVIAISGISRQINFKKFYKNYIEQFNSLKQTLKSYDFPEQAQIIVASPPDRTLKIGNGVTFYSKGTLHYILERRDVKGQILKEACFFDPFQLYNKPYKFRNVDIDTSSITYLFRDFYPDPVKNRRMYYALRWADDKSKDSHWSVFHADEQGRVTNLVSGKGYENYESVVDSLSKSGITRDDILFGGIPSGQDSLRLGL